MQLTVGGATLTDAAKPVDTLLTLPGAGGRLEIDTARGCFTLETHAGRVPLSLRWIAESDGSLAAFELVGELVDGEALVGFGERFDALDQRGRAPDVAVWE